MPRLKWKRIQEGVTDRAAFDQTVQDFLETLSPDVTILQMQTIYEPPQSGYRPYMTVCFVYTEDVTTVCIPRIVRNTDQLAEMIAAADTLKLNWHLQAFSADGGDPLTEDEARKRIGDGRLAWFIITARS